MAFHNRTFDGRLRTRSRCALFGALLAATALLTHAGAAESCSTQAQLKAPERDTLTARARQLTTSLLAGETDAVRQASVADLQSSFNGIAETIASLHGDSGAAVTVSAIYLFENTTARPALEDSEQFYCGENTPEHVTITLSGLHAGRYALVLLHATGVADPRRISLVLQDVEAPAPATANSWKLAGVINRPMLFAAHDSLWFWTQARKYKKNHELWNASVFYEIARQLSLPVGFLSSANTEKLEDEQRSALPVDWPTPAKPLVLTAAGKPVEIASINPAFRGTDVLISLDTVASAAAVSALVTPAADGATAGTPAPQPPVGTPPPGLNTPAEAVAASLVTRVPELKSAFAAIYIHAQNDPVTAVVPMKSL